MCAGSIMNQTQYGSTTADAASPVGEDERKWYMEQGFGDPNEVLGKSAATRGFVSGRNQMPARSARAGKYRGVSAEARYLYRQSLAPKPAAAPAAAPAAVPTLAVPPATTRWAGSALTINPVTS